MTRESVADRLVNYSDAITAFAVVNSLAFLIALSERDVRCSFSDIENTFWGAYAFFFTFLTGSLMACRRAELRLRRGSPNQDPQAAQALKYFHFVRIGIVWTTALACSPLVRMAFSDVCGVSAQ